MESPAILKGLSTFYDRQGQSINFNQFIRHFQDPNYQTLKQEIVGPYKVSTIWLGINHSFGEGPPTIFETMVFEDGEGMCELRYETEAAANSGHDFIVSALKEMIQNAGEFPNVRELISKRDTP